MSIKINHEYLRPQAFARLYITNDPYWKYTVIEAVEMLMKELDLGKEHEPCLHLKLCKCVYVLPMSKPLKPEI